LAKVNTQQEVKNQEECEYLEVWYSDNLDDRNYQCDTLKYRVWNQLMSQLQWGSIEYYRQPTLTRISCPIQAKEAWRKTAQRTANAMQNGQTARVRCETAPMNGTFTKDSAAGLNHLKGSTI
jgi:hypothetical protein